MSVSKKMRFEVFKRDGFICQYCGKTPPDVTLEIDHINPKSKDGKDDINNLVTACFDCNRGKSNVELTKIPNTLKDNLDILKEKELQVKEYNKFVDKIQKRIQKDVEEVANIYTEYYKEWSCSDTFKIQIRNFIRKLGKLEVIDAMEQACIRMGIWEDGCNRALKYFCGICWNKIKKTTQND